MYLCTLIRLLSPIEQAQADVKPGDTITQTIMTEAEALLPASIRWMVEQRILYIDQNFFGVVLMEMYDQARRLWKVYLPCFLYAKQPYQGYPKHPLDGARYQYTDEWAFMPSSVVVDIQKRHATTLETPSSAQQPSECQSEMYFNELVANTVAQASWLAFLNSGNP